MSIPVVVLLTVTALVTGGYGLYQVAYKQGYVCGFEDASPTLTLDDEGDE